MAKEKTPVWKHAARSALLSSIVMQEWFWGGQRLHNINSQLISAFWEFQTKIWSQNKKRELSEAEISWWVSERLIYVSVSTVIPRQTEGHMLVP